MVRIEINNKSPLPIYSQIADQFVHLVATGLLKSGERVPTIRELAVQLEINPNTVAKAYLELQNMGLLDTRQGTGTFIKDTCRILSSPEKEISLNQLTQKFLDDVLRLGYTKEEVLKSVKNMIINLKGE